MIRVSLVLLAALAVPARLNAADALPQPLKLPPGLVQVLPVSKTASYMGEAVRVVNCTEDADNPLGTCGATVFGGYALMDSHLSGYIQIRFSPPVNNVTRFEVSHPGNLLGDDVVMTAPQMWEMTVRENQVIDPPGTVSSGDLNLATGEVTNFEYKVLFFNSFYTAFQQVNPNLRAGAFKFPGLYGSGEAKFEQRADGLLDFTFLGSTFLPLGKYINGDPVRFPLPMCGPLLQCASIPAPGTALHPHVRVSTVEPTDAPCGNNCPDVPFNTVQKFTLFSHNSSLGDNFKLNIPELGIGVGLARSQMQGRVQVQFGARNGDTVPFTVQQMAPAGLIGDNPPGFPTYVSLGLLGHGEYLYFPKQTYYFNEVVTFDDPFEIVTGNLNLKTGQVIGDLNYRTFFSQSIFQGVILLNPGVAPASQRFRGPASFERDARGQLIFRFNGEIVLPVPFAVFPRPDLVSGYPIGAGSTLDLFLRIQGMSQTQPPTAVKSGSAENVLSSVGTRFSYRYTIPCSPAGKEFQFEFTNQDTSKGGTFKMDSLASVVCMNSRGSSTGAGDADGFSFTGFGSWSKDSALHVATVHISVTPGAPFISVLVDGGQIVDLNTKPANPTLP
jgi:hypothetical protein